MRPIVPKIPFGLPDSIRPLNPMMPIGNADMFNSTDANGDPITPAITNQVVNFGHEYVWHCHILSHEEMDMMRPVSVAVDRRLSAPPAVTYARDATTGGVTLGWNDPTPVNFVDLASWGDASNEIGFRVERAVVDSRGRVGAYTEIGRTLANVTGYMDSTAVLGTNYRYRVVAFNAAGSTASAPVGGPTETIPLAPTNAVATLQTGPQVSLTFRDNATNEAFFTIDRAVDGGTFVFIGTAPARNNTGNGRSWTRP